MGINNQQRRAAKAKRRAKGRAHRAASAGWHGNGSRHEDSFTPGELVRAMIELAAFAAGGPHEHDVPVLIDRLATTDRRLVDREAEGILLSQLALLWDHGWLPAEVIRYAARVDARAGRLVATAVAADHARRDPPTLHPRWQAHVDALELPDAGSVGWLATFAADEALGRWAVVRAVLAAVGALGSVGPLPIIIPPPGSSSAAGGTDAGADVDDPVLQKVRALLAQAESTTFEAEAAAFTAKAQELMARHAIDVALLWARTERSERPLTVRVAIGDPYADMKAFLLHVVARHSRCRAVRHPRYGMSSIVGFASDVAGTEMLFTSLLVQSQVALQAEGANAGPGARTRSRSFRSSFLLSFSHRIDQRLAEINAAVQRGAADADDALLPVLAARDDAVDDAIQELFGELRPDIVRGGSDAAGWVRGKLAADLAKLNLADLDAWANGNESTARAQMALALEM